MVLWLVAWWFRNGKGKREQKIQVLSHKNENLQKHVIVK